MGYNIYNWCLTKHNIIERRGGSHSTLVVCLRRHICKMRKSSKTIIVLIGAVVILKLVGSTPAEFLNQLSFDGNSGTPSPAKSVSENVDTSDSSKEQKSNIVAKKYSFPNKKAKIEMFETKDKSLNSLLQKYNWVQGNSEDVVVLSDKNHNLIEFSVFNASDMENIVNQYVYAGKKQITENDVPSLKIEKEETVDNVLYREYSSLNQDQSKSSYFCFIKPNTSQYFILVKINNNEENKDFIKKYSDIVISSIVFS